LIGFLRGLPLAVRPDSVLLDVGGVGYAVSIPLSTFYELERHPGAPVGLHIHTHLREDGISLYGFWTEREKRLFEKLIGVAGVGPRLARVILSGLPVEELLSALARGEAARLLAIPGVGRKTAERVVLELADRVQELLAEAPAAPRAPEDSDVVSALINLGYRAAHAERAVAEARRESPAAEFHDLLRASLRRLSRVSG
jgi:Holliday junction DNA helicase RuvA